MDTIKLILENLIGEWDPIAEGQHFSGIDFQWLAAAGVVIAVFCGLFGLVRTFMRR